HMGQLLITRIAEARTDFLDYGVVERQRASAYRAPFPFELGGAFLNAEFVHQNLDPRLVDVVAAPILVVDAQDRLDIAQQVAAVHERLDGFGDEKRSGPSTPAQ